MKKIALIFPGQGAQKQGMGEDLYNNFDAAKYVFNSADKILKRKISDLCFRGEEKDLKITKNTQPALLTVAIAAYEALKNRLNIAPVCLAGHSLGEYGALYASGALNLENCLTAIQARANFMQEAAENTKGTMAAILGLEAGKISEILQSIEGYVAIANYNEPMQTVITGEIEAVKSACEILKEKGAKRVIPLNVSGAFHSKLMVNAAEKFQYFLQNLEINDPKIPIIANVDAEITKKAEDLRKKMSTQIYSSVQWTKIIEKMLASGVDTFVEIGEGRVLSGLCKKIAPNALILNISDKNTLDTTLEELKK